MLDTALNICYSKVGKFTPMKETAFIISNSKFKAHNSEHGKEPNLLFNFYIAKNHLKVGKICKRPLYSISFYARKNILSSSISTICEF